MMETGIVLRVGLVASGLKASQELDRLLTENGVSFSHKIELTDLTLEHCDKTDLDVWLFDLEEDDWSDILDELLDDSAVPVFINEQAALKRQPHPAFWVQKLIVRLGELVLAESNATISLRAMPDKPQAKVEVDVSYSKQILPIVPASIPKTILKPTGSSTAKEEIEPVVFKSKFPLWVLAASLGGPAALKLFLQTLPDQVDASFILAQHIDKNFVPVLCKIIEDYSSLRVHLPGNRRPVERGEIILAPVESRLYMMSDGTVLTTSGSWTSPYSPCIDDVMKEVAKVWDSTGAIIFSGMAGDAIEGSRAMRKMGHKVWTQSSETCASSDMPEDVVAEGLSEMSGTPEQLARHFIAYIHRIGQAAKAV